jgi:hypothetical protein
LKLKHTHIYINGIVYSFSGEIISRNTYLEAHKLLVKLAEKYDRETWAHFDRKKIESAELRNYLNKTLSCMWMVGWLVGWLVD